MIPVIILAALTLISAVIHIRAEYAGFRKQVYIFKPAMTLFIILIALLTDGSQSGIYQTGIITGLVFSLSGDVFLMLPNDRFIPGLISFLMAHLAYIFAFSQGVGFPLSLKYVLILVVIGGVLYRYLYSGLGKMKIPVFVYMTAILIMTIQAWERWGTAGHWFTLAAGVGAVFFVISDSILAINRFKKPFKSARALILVTYMTAQILIAFSV